MQHPFSPRPPRRTPQRARLASALVAASFLTLLALAPRPAGATTPPTFTVNSSFDAPADTSDTDYTICRTATFNSTCTLRAAIMKANRYAGGGVTINIPSGTYTLTIAPSGTDDDSSGDLNITNTMTINGVSAAGTIIDGNQIDRVFNVNVVDAVGTISNVTIRNGFLMNEHGGGISNIGTLTLNDSVISGNKSMGGGGIVNLNMMTLNSTVVSGNLSVQVGLGEGGGLSNFGTLVMNNSVVSGNQALDGNEGGGIFNGITATLANCLISNNQASGPGGGISNFGTLTLTNSTISNNSSIGSDGGGISNEDIGTVTLTDSTISANSARGSGGGIANHQCGALTQTNSTISNNSALVAGGGIYSYGYAVTVTLTNSTISANGTNGSGGGIYHTGSVHLFHVTIAGNVADRDSNGADYGGGIFRTGGSGEIWNSLIAENYVANEPNDCGGDALTSEDYNYIQTTGTASSCTITGTTAHNITGGDALLGALQYNGGPTPTRALLAGSPGLDRIPPDLCRDALGTAPFPDQRGVPRPVGPLCDIGAYEGEQPAVGYNRNLVRNGDAEAAAGSPSGALVGVPNWRAGAPQVSMTAVPYDAPGGFPSLATDTVPADHGFNFFAGGDSAVAVSIQDIDVSPLAAGIDAGAVSYDCSADLGGYLDQEDNATVEYDFLDQATHLLSQVILGPVAAADRGDLTGLLHRDATGPVPAQTRTVELFVTLTRVTGTGSSNDGYADNIALVLTSTPCVGDCSGTYTVAVNDLITLVNIALGKADAATCPQGIPAGSDVNVALLIQAVNNALNGCSG